MQKARGKMLRSILPTGDIAEMARQLSRVRAKTALVLVVCGLGLIVLAFWIDTPAGTLAVSTAGISLLLLALSARVAARVAAWAQARDRWHLEGALGDMPDAYLLTQGEDGHILWANASARTWLGSVEGAPISTILADLHGEPETFARRLHYLARDKGQTEHTQDLSREGRHYKVSHLWQDQQIWQISRPELPDPREVPGLDLLQFAPDGTLVFASPGLREKLEGKPVQLHSVFAGTFPTAGQRAALCPARFGLGVSAYWLPGTNPEDYSTVLVTSLLDTSNAPETTGPASPESLQGLPVGIAHIDAHGILQICNEEARRLLQLHDCTQQPLSDLVEGLGRPIVEWIADISAGRMPRATEVLRLTRTPVETYLKVTLCSPLDIAPDRLIAIISDVTEFKSLEAKFTQSQKMQAIGQLAGGVAHDFNNLLTAISGHCDLLLLRHDRHDPDYPDLMQIQQNTNRAAALVRQLLALSRKQSLQFVTLDLQETMGDIIHLLNRLVGEKITLTLRHGEGVAAIRSDKRQFEQVLMNLVVNARDALPMGGEIRIETEACDLPQGLTRDQVMLPPGDYTCIRISDDGIGIPQSLLPKIFDPFFTTKRQGEGTGLGLSTVYGIVKQSGGFIFVDSEEGVGTSFTLYFSAQKAAKPAPAAPRAPRAVQAAAFNRPRALVLLVEDEAPVRSFAARALELQGHRVITAESGEAALEILSDQTVRPDCFVSDVIMPGLDGPGWISQVRDRFPETPVLFISGYAEDNRLAAQARISNATFLGKPFSLAEFTTAVDEQLRRPSAAA